jgi:hypothetical protein
MLHRPGRQNSGIATASSRGAKAGYRGTTASGQRTSRASISERAVRVSQQANEQGASRRRPEWFVRLEDLGDLAEPGDEEAGECRRNVVAEVVNILHAKSGELMLVGLERPECDRVGQLSKTPTAGERSEEVRDVDRDRPERRGLEVEEPEAVVSDANVVGTQVAMHEAPKSTGLQALERYGHLLVDPAGVDEVADDPQKCVPFTVRALQPGAPQSWRVEVGGDRSILFFPRSRVRVDRREAAREQTHRILRRRSVPEQEHVGERAPDRKVLHNDEM